MKGYIRKGYALMALKEHAKASATFQKALEIDSNNQVFIFSFILGTCICFMQNKALLV